MWISPATPTGTGSPSRVEHVDRACWRSAGRSAGSVAASRPSVGSTSQVLSTAVSVGPYALTSCVPSGRTRRAAGRRRGVQRLAAADHRRAARRRLRPVGSRCASSGSSTAGTKSATVHAVRRSRRVQAGAVQQQPTRAEHQPAAEASARTTSTVKTSNEKLAHLQVHAGPDAGRTGGPRRRRRSPALPCSTITPLGGAGGAGGVDHVGQVVRRPDPSRPGRIAGHCAQAVGVGHPGRRTGVSSPVSAACSRSRRGGRGSAATHRRAVVAAWRPAARPGTPGPAARRRRRLEDRQQRHHHLQAALDAERHQHVRADARRAGGGPAGWPARSARA